MTRKQAREEAFILVFEKEFNDNTVEEIFEAAAEARDLEPDGYITKVFPAFTSIGRSLTALYPNTLSGGR